VELAPEIQLPTALVGVVHTLVETHALTYLFGPVNAAGVVALALAAAAAAGAVVGNVVTAPAVVVDVPVAVVRSVAATGFRGCWQRGLIVLKKRFVKIRI
jgi:hypothetical protein